MSADNRKVLSRTSLGVGLLAAVAASLGAAHETDPVARGRYVVLIGGCNDCHTAGYTEAGGKLPDKDWLTGSGVGWRGPWGTTYASNLRLYMQQLSEEQWVQTARSAQYRPPMPWWALHEMSEPDLRALYHFVRQLGAAGQAMPAYVPAGQVPKGPVVQFPSP